MTRMVLARDNFLELPAKRLEDVTWAMLKVVDPKDEVVGPILTHADVSPDGMLDFYNKAMDHATPVPVSSSSQS